jgi:serine protease inhibitor
MKKLDNFKKIADINLNKLDMSQESKQKLRNEVNKPMKTNFKRLGFIGIPAAAAVVAFVVFFTGIFSNNPAVRVSASDLMKGITAQKVEAVELGEHFLNSTANFSIELFKKAYTKGENSLISPSSVYLALGMTANGANENTLKEFENLLGGSGINIEELNAHYHSLARKLTRIDSGRVDIANSIWYRDDDIVEIKKDFLQINADYYKAAAYKANFNSPDTVKDINNWVKDNTGNLIDKIIDEIDVNTIMYLINAVYFEDQWKKGYEKKHVRQNTFTLQDGTKKSVDFMYSEEEDYLKDDKAEGFIKPYKNEKYSFVALLPNEGISIDSYISSLSGKSFTNLLKNGPVGKVSTGLPKFKSEFKVELVEPLKKMGLRECFDDMKANFSKMSKDGINGNIYVGDVLHKTFITVDDQGTKAGAVTKVEVRTKSAGMAHSVILNRPFVYAIVDNETKLPIFIGTMMNPEF